jgi:hypothetical protein
MSRQGPTATIRLSLQYGGAWLEYVQSAATRPHTVLIRLSPMAPIEKYESGLSLQQPPALTVSAKNYRLMALTKGGVKPLRQQH